MHIESLSQSRLGHTTMVSTIMRIQQSLIVCTAALVVSTSTSYAGPCSKEIARFRAEINAKQRSNVGTAPSAPEHRSDDAPTTDVAAEGGGSNGHSEACE